MYDKWMMRIAVGLTVATATIGCQCKPTRSPKILGSVRSPGNLQAPPLNSRTPIAVPTAPVGTPVPAVAVPLVPAQPAVAVPAQPVVPAVPAPAVAVPAQPLPGGVPTPVVPQNSTQEPSQYRPPVQPAVPTPDTSGSTNKKPPGNDPFFGDTKEIKPLDAGEPGESGIK